MNALVFISASFVNAVTALTGIVGWLVGGGSTGGIAAGLTDGVGTNARFSSPTKLTEGTSGNLFITDTNNNNIRQFVISTANASTLAGSTSSVAGYLDGVGTNALFNKPVGVAYDGSGNLFVTDTSNNLIRKIDLSTAVVTSLAGGSGGTASGFANGIGTNALFNAPQGICYDGSGNLFVADTANNRIRQIVISTASVTTLAGAAGTGPANGVGTNANFTAPQGICYLSGSLYVADTGAGSTRKIVISTALVSTFTGIPRYNTPSDLYPDSVGNLYITDKVDNIVYRIVISTGISSVFLGIRTVSGFVNGTGTSAQFRGPSGIYIDSSPTRGYLCDSSNNVIRTIT